MAMTAIPARSQEWRAVYSRRERADEYPMLMRLAGGKWHKDMLGAAVHALSLVERPPARVLELGIGTGKLASRILRRYRRAALYGIDGSGAMLRKARENLRGFGDRIHLIREDFGRRHWRDALPECDAVVSTIAVHHLTDAGKKKLFRDAFACLRSGGIFVNGDPVWPADAVLRERDDLMWAAYIQGRFKKVTGEIRTIASIRRWIDETRTAERDKPAGLECQLAWLREAGFIHVDCFWKTFGFAVFGGMKP